MRIDESRPAPELRQLAHEGSRPVGNDVPAAARFVVLSDVDVSVEDDGEPGTEWSAAVMPKMIPLWICARTVSGLTAVPQSTAQTTRRTRTAPSLPTSTSAASARTALARGALSRRASRYATGSCFAAAASSSMKLSVTNTLWDGPTLRQNAVGMPGGSTRTYSTCMFGSA